MERRSTGDGSAAPDRYEWRETAERAGFTFFEPVGPGRTSTWAGRFGWDTHEPSHLAVMASIDGAEVEVETRLSSPRRTADSGRRQLVLDLLFPYLMSEGLEVVPPMSIEVVADDRTIAVAGQDLLFSGARIDGFGRWAGEVERGDTAIRVVTPTDAPLFSIEPCTDWRSMAEFPPAGP